MVVTDINLLKAKTATFPLSVYEEKLRQASWLALAILFVTGILVGSSFLWLSQRVRMLEEEKTQLGRGVSALPTTEGLVVSLKRRSTMVAKVLAAIRPWGSVFGLLEAIAPTTPVSNLAVDERGRVTSYFELPSIDEAIKVVAGAMQLYDEQKIRSPQLLSLFMRENGRVQLGVSFVPVW